MTRIVQEKFQVTVPQNRNEEDGGWVSPASARRANGTPSGKRTKFNAMPPGENIENQSVSEQHDMPLSMGGESDVSKDWNEGSVKNGYTRRKLLGTDDEYSNQHSDMFYGEVKVDSEVGFAERGNLLDRL